MRERIILAPGANEKELLRSLALQGIGTLGLRIVSGVGLAELAMMRSGKVWNGKYLSYREQVTRIYSILQNTKSGYFQNTSYADAENITQAINQLRMLSTEEEDQNVSEYLRSGEFPEKNEAFLEIYKQYKCVCADQNLEDGPERIRSAIHSVEPLNADVFCLKEFPCSPLERCLVDAVSNGMAQQIRVNELFKRDEGKEIAIQSYTSAYGAINEAADIIGRIFSEGLPLDECVIAAADPDRYAQLFYDLTKSYGIPTTFGCGIPVLNTNPARLLKAISVWENEGCCGIDAWNNLTSSPAFDRSQIDSFLPGGDDVFVQRAKLLKLCGSLRLGRDKETNQKHLSDYQASLPEGSEEFAYVLSAQRLAHELERGYSHILRSFSRIRKGSDEGLDQAALKTLCDAIDALQELPEGNNVDSLITLLLSKTVCAQCSESGKLHVTSLRGAMCSVRKHLFVAGLSADVFPGSPKENYLLLDSDLESISNSVTSEENIRLKKQEYEELLSLYTALNFEIRLSFANYDPAELKSRNISSVVLDTFRKQYGRNAEDADFNNAGYYDRIFSTLDAYGRKYKAGKQAVGYSAVEELGTVSYDLEKAYAVSAVETWRLCPRRFFLRYVLQLKEPEEDDPYVVIDRKTTGELVHELLESITPTTDKGELMMRAETVFNNYLAQRPPITSALGERARDEFLELIENGWDSDPGNTPLSSEKELEARHPCGVIVHGKPDRIERTDDGRIIVVDYKTGHKLRHQNDDFDSCFQALLYAYILENRSHSGDIPELDTILEVDHVEYRYPRINSRITCNWNQEQKEKMSKTLEEFHNDLVNGNYMPGAECDEYCMYKAVCRTDCREETEE